MLAHKCWTVPPVPSPELLSLLVTVSGPGSRTSLTGPRTSDVMGANPPILRTGKPRSRDGGGGHTDSQAGGWGWAGSEPRHPDSPAMFLLGLPDPGCRGNLALRPLCLGLRNHRHRAGGGGRDWVPPAGRGSGIWPPSSATVTVNKASGRTPSILTV